MLAIAAFAIQNASVPATAPGEFYAQMLTQVNERTDTVIADQMAECFLPDQNLADHTDAFIQAVLAKDWTTVEATVKTLTPSARADFEPCKDSKYQVANDAEFYEEHWAENAMNDPDWQIKLLRYALPHKGEIT